MNLLAYVTQELRESVATKNKLMAGGQLASIMEAAEVIIAAYESNHKVLFVGNGGSAADAQHLAAELVGRFAKDRKSLAAMSLSTDSSIVTAISNDYGYDEVFARQIEAYGKSGDVLVCISTSGNSKNILNAVHEAHKQEMVTIALTGAKGVLADLCDIAIRVPSESTPRIQECHIAIGHVICGAVERELFK